MIRKSFFHTLVIGSGAAGLAAAVRLEALGVKPIAIYTEGLRSGTSINTGSDKQTYYKLSLCGEEPDSPMQMARDLMAGGAVHGDLALAEAANSTEAFCHLALLGVPFPHDVEGQFAGYKTDHDPRCRATSCGPYTSREMCRALIREMQRRQIPVWEHKICIQLLVESAHSQIVGALFMDNQTGEVEAVEAQNVIFATGGPGNLYESSVYPLAQTGGIGLALEAGAKARNLAEFQYGLASTKFRWNVSGSYMQVLPDFVSTDQNGENERLFLMDYFSSPEEMYSTIFLKGYQWPFAAGHVPGSSLIDIFVYVEMMERHRLVFLDYRHNRLPLHINRLSEEARLYLDKSGILNLPTPIERLRHLNPLAIELYAEHHIDLSQEMLEVAVCAQHNNGGLAGNCWWQSENIHLFFPVGEVNGSHGITRPGGTALNAGQVGAFRAAEYIARRQTSADEMSVSGHQKAFESLVARAVADLEQRLERGQQCDWREERRRIQHRMSEAGGFVRSEEKILLALEENRRQLQGLEQTGLAGLSPKEQTETLRTRSLAIAQFAYLNAMLEQCRAVGSRGGSLVLAPGGEKIHPALGEQWRLFPEVKKYREMVMTNLLEKKRGGEVVSLVGWEPCRPIPQRDEWFENVWRAYREGQIYQEKDKLNE